MTLVVALRKGGAAQEADIDALEEAIGHAMPSDWAAFVAENDGAYAQRCYFDGHKGNVGVRGFVPTADIATKLTNVDGFADDAPDCVPIAFDEGGNYFALNYLTGEVSFWDAEIEGETLWLAGSFDEFLAGLRPDPYEKPAV